MILELFLIRLYTIFCLLIYLCLFLLYDVLCSPQLNSLVGQPFTKDVSPATCSGDDNSVSRIPTCVIGDSASDVVESHLSCQNNVLNLSEESMAQSSHCSQSELVKDRSFDSVTLLPFLSTDLQTMKRADSLPSSLLRYVLVPNCTYLQALSSFLGRLRRVDLITWVRCPSVRTYVRPSVHKKFFRFR